MPSEEPLGSPVAPPAGPNHRVIARNTVQNIAAQMVPLAAAFLATPFLVHTLGTQRFGLFALAMTLVGYFGVFDFGFGRSLTKLVAERLAQGAEDDVPSLIWTALAMMAGLAVVAVLVFTLVAKILVMQVLTVPEELRAEALTSFYILGGCTSVTILSAGLQGVIEGHQRFDLSARVRMGMGLGLVIGPIIAALISPRLTSVTIALLVVRFGALLAYLYNCLRVEPHLTTRIDVRRSQVGPLLRFGGWMTVGNLVGPVATYADRFLIGTFLSLTAVAYYTVPYDALTRLWFIPDGMLGVLFPAFTAALAVGSEQLGDLFRRGVKLVVLAMFPVTLLAMVFAREALRLWLGTEFEVHSTSVWQWLAAGVFINSLMRVPYVLVQSAGRPDLMAKMHVIELPFYIGLLAIILPALGPKGAAILWTARVVIVGPLLYWWAAKYAPGAVLTPRWGVVFAAIAVAFVAAGLIGSAGLAVKIAFAAIVISVFYTIGWRLALTPGERGWLLGFLPGSLARRAA